MVAMVTNRQKLDFYDTGDAVFSYGYCLFLTSLCLFPHRVFASYEVFLIHPIWYVLAYCPSRDRRFFRKSGGVGKTSICFLGELSHFVLSSSKPVFFGETDTSF